ncbi:membrane protein [Marivita lacus]|uniref:Membrane protein n=1 Tax=Marivita lacus TaxID=1323742 RepID=A0ABQ1L2N2_9RHOB|nr:membrane protein [Marivita lacus]
MQVAFWPDLSGHPAYACIMTTLTDSHIARGITLVCIGVFAISINDMLIKMLSDGYPLHQIVFTRTAIGIILSFVMLHLEGGLSLLRTNRPSLHILRGLTLVAANMTFFASLAVLPLGLTTALFFVGPLFITLFSFLFLGEKVGPLRLGAIVFGFMGVIVMQEPWSDGSEYGPPWLFALPVIAASLYAAMAVMTRALGVKSTAAALTIYNQVMFLVVSSLFYLLVGQGQADPGPDAPSLHFLLRAWTWPSQQDWPLFILTGVCNGIIAYCITAAYRMAPSASIAPFEYIGLPLAIFWGWLFFAEWPTPSIWTGCAMILGAGLFVFLRERRKGKVIVPKRPGGHMR